MASSSYGMTLAGFIPKRLADIQNDMNASIALIVDPHTGEYPFQNVTDDAVLQQVVGVFASALEEAWEAAYEASVQFDPQKNTGAGQSGTVQLNAITRKAEWPGWTPPHSTSGPIRPCSRSPIRGLISAPRRSA